MNGAAWLQGLGLERYEQVFREDRIETDMLPSLIVEDSKDLAVTLVSDRRRLLDAIAALGSETPAAVVTVASRDAPAQADAERRHLIVLFCDLVGATACRRGSIPRICARSSAFRTDVINPLSASSGTAELVPT